MDRSFSELDVSSERRLYGKWSRILYKFVSFNWQSENDQNFINAKNCFKIATCDPIDEVIDNFSALPTGVAEKLSKHSYSASKWRAFFNSLCLIYDLERKSFGDLSN